MATERRGTQPAPEDRRQLVRDLVAMPPNPRDPIWRWANLAEVLLDESGWIPKPPDPTGNDLDRAHRHAGVGEYEDIVRAEMQRLAMESGTTGFRASVRQYRRDIKRLVKEWRRAGLL